MKNIIFILLLVTNVVFSQVGIGTTTPSSAAVLHLETANYDTTKVGGFIMPVVTEAEQALIPVDVSTTRDDGLMVFVSDPITGKWCWDIYDAEQLVWRSIKCNTVVAAVCDTQIYLEDFSGYTLNTGRDRRNDSGDYPSVPWSINDSQADYLNQDSDYAYTNASGQFELNDTDGPIILTLDPVDISSYATVCFSVDIAGIGDLEYKDTLHSTDDTNNQNDYVNVEYSIDGGAWVRILDFGGNGDVHHTLIAPENASDGPFPDSTVSESGLSGNTLRIRITSQTWANSEYFTYDNIIVEGGN